MVLNFITGFDFARLRLSDRIYLLENSTEVSEGRNTIALADVYGSRLSLNAVEFVLTQHIESTKPIFTYVKSGCD